MRHKYLARNIFSEIEILSCCLIVTRYTEDFQGNNINPFNDNITVMSHEHHHISNHWETQLFIHQVFQTYKKHQIPYYWPFVRGIHLWPVDSPHKGPAMWIAFPHDVIVSPKSNLSLWHLITVYIRVTIRTHDKSWYIKIYIAPWLTNIWQDTFHLKWRYMYGHAACCHPFC